MAKQVLIYERAVPLSKERHGNWSVKTGTEYGFAREVNSVPLTAVEFPSAAGEYPIVFAGDENTIMPVAVLGVAKEQNLYINEDDTWRARYVPAFIRRFPFVFASGNEGKTFTLCIDESFSGCNQEGRGEHLFDSEGNSTQYLETMLNFLKQYQVHFRMTQAFCAKLKELGVLETMQARFTSAAGEQRSLSGFMVINRDKLKALPDKTLAEMAKTDQLELAYLHLHSMRNFNQLLERNAEQNRSAAPAPAPEPEPILTEDGPADDQKIQ